MDGFDFAKRDLNGAGGLKFEDALRLIKAGGWVARRHWINTYLALVSAKYEALYPTRDGRSHVGEIAMFCPKCAQKHYFMPWFVSVFDLLADDWIEIKSDEFWNGC